MKRWLLLLLFFPAVHAAPSYHFVQDWEEIHIQDGIMVGDALWVAYQDASGDLFVRPFDVDGEVWAGEQVQMFGDFSEAHAGVSLATEGDTLYVVSSTGGKGNVGSADPHPCPVSAMKCLRVTALDTKSGQITPPASTAVLPPGRPAAIWAPSPPPAYACSGPCLIIAFGSQILTYDPTTGAVLPADDLEDDLAAKVDVEAGSDSMLFMRWDDGNGLATFDVDSGTLTIHQATLQPGHDGEKATFVNGDWWLAGANADGRFREEIYRFNPAADEIVLDPDLMPNAAGFAAAATRGSEALFLGELFLDDVIPEQQPTFVAVSTINQVPTLDLAGPQTGAVAEQMQWQCSAEDPDGTIASYDWSFGDGATGTGEQVTHAYAEAGTYTVEVTVTDDEGATASDSVQVLVTDAPPPGGGASGGNNNPPPPAPNEAPTAAFTATGSILRASFNAATSSDPDGDPLTYAWDFGDGATGSGRAPTHEYTNAGSYTVTLTVSDGEDSDTATKTVTVDAPVAPIAAVTLSASSIIEGASVTADASASTKGSGTNTFTWSLDGITKGTGVTKSFSPGVGTHTVTLVVVNEYGQESAAQKSFTVSPKAVEPTPTPTATTTTTTAPAQNTPDAGKESPAGLFLIPALLAVAWISRRK